MGEAVANNEVRCLWDETRKMSRSSDKLPTMMDGLTDKLEIANIFTSKYKLLYNSVGNNKHDMELLRKKIDTKIANNCSNNTEKSDHNHIITVKEVKDALDIIWIRLQESEHIRIFLLFSAWTSSRASLIA